MTTLVRCPARPHEGRISRLLCLLMVHADCVRCPNRNFRVVFPDLHRKIQCPVLRLAKELKHVPMSTLRVQNPTLAKDIQTARNAERAGGQVELQVCKLRRPFYTCVACRGREDYAPRS